MKNNTATTKVDRNTIRERFKAITGSELNSFTLHQAMTQGLVKNDHLFRDTLIDAFKPALITCDLSTEDTWMVLSDAFAFFDECLAAVIPLKAVEPDLEPSDSLSIYKDAKQLETPHRQGKASQTAEETPLAVGHLEDPNWRDERI